MSFKDLQLIEPILAALSKEGYTAPTQIQQQSIPFILQGKDLLGHAQTGTGKTAAFAIPILQMMHSQLSEQPAHQGIQALILTPTRELAIQIGESIKAYGRFLPFKHEVIFGGVPQFHQVHAIRRGVDILVATPGRLLDLLKQNVVHLNNIKYFVLDEADRMLDMGFVHDVKRIIARLPIKKQTLFFSATMPMEIKQLASTLLNNPVKVEVNPVSSTTEMVQQQVYYVEKMKKLDLLVYLLKDESIKTMLVFIQMKHHADKLAKQLNNIGIPTEAMHGNKLQNVRQRALHNFKTHKTRVLVATDIAARGIDIDELTHVLNYDLPNVPETYVHRIGRTGRAGAKGLAISFCDWSEKSFLNDIQQLIRKPIPVIKGHPFDNSLMHAEAAEVPRNLSLNRMRRGGKRNRTFMQA
ncbi:MAG: DEAD/DEAH box helicase [Bacteroidetes bacterium]|nr:DEAD/DEAH box helicase [Bacteroidota bacterium]MBS1974567.1 DEAD/DEAH box helicase [Bacteroidota bacterium]